MKKQMKILAGTLVLFSTCFSHVVLAELHRDGVDAPTSKEEFCTKSQDADYFRSILYNERNHLAYDNQGGIADAGVCWWHSMFSRNAAYLAVYRPDLPKLNHQDAIQAIKDIVANNGVVEIPGYEDLQDFSGDYADEIQSALEGWQLADGGLGFGWVRGVTGATEVEPQKLKQMMDDLYEEVKSGRAVYQMLQMPGIEAHAWLVLDVRKQDTSYEIDVLDSNNRSVYTVNYEVGSTKLRNYDAVPYTSRNGMAYMSYSTARSNYCKRGMTARDSNQVFNKHR